MIKYENDNGIRIKSMQRMMSEKKNDKTVFKLMKRDNRTVKKYLKRQTEFKRNMKNKPGKNVQT